MGRKYKLGDKWSDDFDYDGMIEMGLKTNSTWSISDLQKLYDSMEDVNYHTPNKYLGQAIFALENDMPDVADIKFAKFHKELKAIGEEEEDALNMETIKFHLTGNFESYNKGIREGESDLVNIEDIYDVREYIEKKLGDVVESVNEVYKGKNYPYNQSNPYYQDLYRIKLKDGNKFDLLREYGRPNWSGNVDYIESIEVKKSGDEYAHGGETIKNYQVIGTVIKEVGSVAPPEADIEDYIDREREDFSISVMASSEDEAAAMAEEQMMDKHLLDKYGTSLTGQKQYYAGEVEIDDVIETGRYDEGGETDSLEIEIEYDEETDTYEVEYEFDGIEISGVLEKYYTGRDNQYEFKPSYFEDKRAEEYYEEHWEEINDEILSVFHSKFKKGGQVKRRRKYGEGGDVGQGNLEMMKNQAIQVKHHADELIEALKQNPRIDAWVVSLMDRATQNLSNITHYLDGELKHFSKGGRLK